jgi:hypothetical protein
MGRGKSVGKEGLTLVSRVVGAIGLRRYVVPDIPRGVWMVVANISKEGGGGCARLIDFA